MAAELNEEGGIASQKFLEEQILGEDVYVVVDKHNRVGKWGRLLGRVEHLGFDMGEQSKSMGFAIGLEAERMDVLTLRSLLD